LRFTRVASTRLEYQILDRHEQHVEGDMAIWERSSGGRGGREGGATSAKLAELMPLLQALLMIDKSFPQQVFIYLQPQSNSTGCQWGCPLKSQSHCMRWWEPPWKPSARADCKGSGQLRSLPATILHGISRLPLGAQDKFVSAFFLKTDFRLALPTHCRLVLLWRDLSKVHSSACCNRVQTRSCLDSGLESEVCI
jgi:hypothetical protein